MLPSTDKQQSKENHSEVEDRILVDDVLNRDGRGSDQQTEVGSNLIPRPDSSFRTSIMSREALSDLAQVQCEQPQSPQSTSDSSNSKDQHELMAMLSSDGVSNTNIPVLDVHKGKPVRVQVKVVVPVHDHPNFNFVGKLLGPKGNSLKWLQEQTQTKMAILGRGSMRDKQKEEDLRKLGDPKYNHLNEDLHVEITAFAPAPDAYSRIGHALHEVKRFLVPDYYDEIRQQQLMELGVLSVDKRNGKSRINDGPAPVPQVIRDPIDHTTIHQIPSNTTSKATPQHLAIPHSNGYSDNHCPSFIASDNDSDLSHYPNWQKKTAFKITSNISKGFYRERPYARTYDMFQ